ncbi:MAG: endopeptidase La [Calditrichaeota bacterium]|nr:endopeptidase La [Calditrichota bacterium]
MNSQSNIQPISTPPNVLPLFITDELVIFPGVITPVIVKDEEQIRLVGEALNSPNKSLAVILKRPDTSGDKIELFDIGSVVSVVKMLRIPDGTLRLLMQGMARMRLDAILPGDSGYALAQFTIFESKPASGLQVEALTRKVRDDFSEVIDAAPYLPYEMKVALINITDAGSMCDFIGANLNIRPDERQEILAAVNVHERLKLISKYVDKELKLLKLGSKIQNEVTGAIEKSQREYYLREQMKAIKRELGEEEEGAEIRELKVKLEKLQASDRVKETAERELERLSNMNPSSAEYTVARTYLDWLFDLPWQVATVDSLDIQEARKTLDRDHYGLEDVKERILEYLAVKKLRGDGRGSIICFVGPPGVGKTSIGKSIAEAMGRKFVRMSLGGLRDEAEIRGHRRTYIGALPGRIIQNLKRAGTNNPVFMLDEIDKLGSDFRGDPSSAMLEVLDPEQNFAFQDNYLELDFDLSKVMFITTANYLETIPPPLRDRMEIIKLPGYITPEKVMIGKRYLVPRQIKENGLAGRNVHFTDKTLEHIIVYYTREAGVRTLERTLGKVCRKIAVKVAEDPDSRRSFNITTRNAESYLGPAQIQPDLHGRAPRVGIATGLAWTAVGGVMLQIEAIAMPGEGRMKITGQLGDVMKESAEIAMSYLRAKADKLHIPLDYFKKNDFHIHIPEGATPKDGPSAGITLTSALASLFTGRPVRHDVAMTGEITLQGRVLPIGGLREKSVAAGRGHMEVVICPEGNRADLEEIPDIVKSKLEFRFVSDIDETLRLALLPKSKKKAKAQSNG